MAINTGTTQSHVEHHHSRNLSLTGRLAPTNVTISRQATTTPLHTSSTPAAQPDAEHEHLPEVTPSARLQIMIAMIQYLSGKTITHYSPRAHSASEPSNRETTPPNASPPAGAEVVHEWPALLTPQATYGARLTETEALSFQLSANVELASGAHINVNLNETLTRRVNTTLTVNAQVAATLIDPLVINLAGSLSLQSRTATFDLNADGTQDTFSQLGHGSYYLAHDINDDNIINDGSELFGAISGDGFKELALHDSDNNGLIDSRDAIFNDLLVFRPGDKSSQKLADTGVVAIGLNAIDTPFTFSDAQGVTQAQLRSSSYFIRDDASSGSVQHIDLAV